MRSRSFSKKNRDQQSSSSEDSGEESDAAINFTSSKKKGKKVNFDLKKFFTDLGAPECINKL